MASDIPELLDCDSLRQDSSEPKSPSSRSRVKETHPIRRGSATFRLSLLPRLSQLRRREELRDRTSAAFKDRSMRRLPY
jgi:hypothetical protein